MILLLSQNKALQAWVTSVCAEEGPVIIKGKKMKVPVMLSIAYNDLIGLGQDDFFISQKFLVMVSFQLHHKDFINYYSSFFQSDITSKCGPVIFLPTVHWNRWNRILVVGGLERGQRSVRLHQYCHLNTPWDVQHAGCQFDIEDLWVVKKIHSAWRK